MKNRWLTILIFLLCFTLVLSGCGKENHGKVKELKETGKSNSKGGTLNVGIAEPPEGEFQSIFTGSDSDDEVINYFNDSLVDAHNDLKLKPKILSWKALDKDKRTYEFKMKKGIKWQDGNPLTINDWIFTLETLADPQYDGPRYSNVQIVKGADAKHDGKHKSISGIKKINNYTAKVTFKEPKANNLDTLWMSSVISKKIFQHIPVKDMAKSDAVRKHPIGIGPYKVKRIVDGESVEFVKNKHYYRGEPGLDKVNLRVVEQTSLTEALNNKEIDMASVTAPVAKEIKDSKNKKLNILRAPGTSYVIIGFVLNDYDKAKQKVGKPRPKFQNKKLRQALTYAINRNEWVDAFLYGYGKKLNGLIPSSFWSAADKGQLNAYPYNPKKAKKLLDEAGYKDRNGDGWREDPHGKKFEINLKHYAGSNPTFEPRTAAIKGFWENVGIKTKTDMVEFGKYNTDLESGSKDMEAYVRTWTQGSDPDPSDLYKSDALWNEGRYNNPKADKKLAEAKDPKVVGDSQAKRKKKYLEWQKIMNENEPYIPLAESDDMTAVNNRVKNVKVSLKGTNPIYKWTVDDKK
jgi:peptide/nickel transport system substrate-binding protein